ncbi:hypothetical protein ZHAS_00021997 [Anopheles sinensis]|uniref:Uncharacterized protein n=1 Tax=Anopheles sinensis TaxID=74873 RepID=A0A084WTE3_ANOSI|nr:hypothetical protein ZHAS_00021997 [Anopheles sinensis]
MTPARGEFSTHHEPILPGGHHDASLSNTATFQLVATFADGSDFPTGCECSIKARFVNKTFWAEGSTGLGVGISTKTLVPAPENKLRAVVVRLWFAFVCWTIMLIIIVFVSPFCVGQEC